MYPFEKMYPPLRGVPVKRMVPAIRIGKPNMRELMRPDEAALRLRVSKQKVYFLVKNGDLESSTIGQRTVRIFKDSVEALIEAGIPASAP